MGHSDGAEMAKATFNVIIPVLGMESRLKDIMKNKRYCTATFLVDGDAENVEGRIVGRTYNSDSKTGALKGAYSFEGGGSVY
jgi:hypothetical protein